MTQFAKPRYAVALIFLLFAGAASAQSSLFWSLEKNGEPAGYLLGTIHSEDPRVLDFPDPFIELMNSNRWFAMELVPDLPTLARLADYMHYQDGTRLADVIGEDRFLKLSVALGEYKLVPEMADKMKVWAVMMTLSVPPPSSGFFMDLSLSLRAAGSGMKVVGLETLEQQLSFLEEMPLELQLELLDQALEEYGKVKAVHLQLVDTYLTGDIEALEALSGEQMEGLDEATRQYFIAEGIDARNRRMVETLLPYLEQGTVFVAVGALHLPGEQGLVSLLRRNGFIVEPLPLPFSTAE